MEVLFDQGEQLGFEAFTSVFGDYPERAPDGLLVLGASA